MDAVDANGKRLSFHDTHVTGKDRLQGSHTPSSCCRYRMRGTAFVFLVAASSLIRPVLSRAATATAATPERRRHPRRKEAAAVVTAGTEPCRGG